MIPSHLQNLWWLSIYKNCLEFQNVCLIPNLKNVKAWFVILLSCYAVKCARRTPYLSGGTSHHWWHHLYMSQSVRCSNISLVNIHTSQVSWLEKSINHFHTSVDIKLGSISFNFLSHYSLLQMLYFDNHIWYIRSKVHAKMYNYKTR